MEEQEKPRLTQLEGARGGPKLPQRIGEGCSSLPSWSMGNFPISKGPARFGVSHMAISLRRLTPISNIMPLGSGLTFSHVYSCCPLADVEGTGEVTLSIKNIDEEEQRKRARPLVKREIVNLCCKA